MGWAPKSEAESGMGPETVEQAKNWATVKTYIILLDLEQKVVEKFIQLLTSGLV